MVLNPGASSVLLFLQQAKGNFTTCWPGFYKGTSFLKSGPYESNSPLLDGDGKLMEIPPVAGSVRLNNFSSLRF